MWTRPFWWIAAVVWCAPSPVPLPDSSNSCEGNFISYLTAKIGFTPATTVVPNLISTWTTCSCRAWWEPTCGPSSLTAALSTPFIEVHRSTLSSRLASYCIDLQHLVLTRVQFSDCTGLGVTSCPAAGLHPGRGAMPQTAVLTVFADEFRPWV